MYAMRWPVLHAIVSLCYMLCGICVPSIVLFSGINSDDICIYITYLFIVYLLYFSVLQPSSHALEYVPQNKPRIVNKTSASCHLLEGATTIFHGCSACLKGALVCFSTNVLKNVTNVIISETEKKQDTRAPTHTDSQICNPLNASCGCVKGITSALSVNFHSRAYLLLMNTATC